MKTRNLILQAAISSALLVMAGSSFATTVSTGSAAPAFAKELFQGTTPNATALTLPPIVVTSNVSIPANSTVYVYVKLNGASISTIPTVLPGVAAAKVEGGVAGASTALAADNLGTTTGTANPAAVGAGVDYLVFKLENFATPIGVGATIATIGDATALQVNNATALLTAPITATASVGLGAPVNRFGALPAAASSYDATSTAVNVATSTQGISLTATANTNAGLIDLAASPIASQFTTTGSNTAVSATVAQLGTFKATNSATAVKADGTTAYTMAGQAAATGLSLTVAAPAGFFAALGTTGVMTLDSSATCAGASAGVNGMASAVFATDAAAAAATSVTIPSTALPTSATPYYLCMVLPTHTATSPALVPATPTLAATLTHTATNTDSNNSVAATNMYPLAYNGSQIDINNFVPAAVTGYTNFIRVINTGSRSAEINVAKIDSTTGNAGASGVLGGSGFVVAPGATVNFTPAQVDAALGTAISGSERPRLRITAQTNGLKGQSLLSQPNGIVGEFSSSQGQ